ncbi:threonine synthase [Alphaproteobacteria bacterium]|nr:threonine synthase [Alphaproteobacteria bacterium]
MQYLPARNDNPSAALSATGFLAALTAAGGASLMVPSKVPALTGVEIRAMAAMPTEVLTARLLALFAPNPEALASAAAKACRAAGAPAVFPLTQIAHGKWVLTAHRFPTLSFADFPAILALEVMQALGANPRGFVASADGDIGAALIRHLAPRTTRPVVLIHPYGKLPELPRRVMTTCGLPNVHILAAEGGMDEAHAMARAAAARFGWTAVDDTNIMWTLAWLAPIFQAALALGAPEREVSFAVSDPQGTFAAAAVLARRMGLNVGITQAEGAAWEEFSAHATLPAPRSSAGATVRPANMERLLHFAAPGDRAAGLFLDDPLRPLSSEAFAAVSRRVRGARVPDTERSDAVRAVWETHGLRLSDGGAAAVVLARDAQGIAVAADATDPIKDARAWTAATKEQPRLPQALASVQSSSSKEKLTVVRNLDAIAKYMETHFPAKETKK